MVESVGGIVRVQARLRGDAVAIVAPGRPALCFGELERQISRTVTELRDFGVGARDRVAVSLRNGPEAATCFLGVAEGCACAPLNPDYREAELEFYLGDLRPAALITDAEAGSAPAVVAERLGIPVLRVCVESEGRAGVFRLSASGERVRPVADEPGDGEAALLLHTSGTTSRPKLVPLTAANLCASARNIADWLQLTPEDRCLNVMPLFHIHGLVAAVLATVSSGGSVVCTPGLEAPRFLDWLEEFRPSWYTAVPTMHQAIVAAAEREAARATGSRLRFIRSSSAALPVRVLRELEERFGAPVVEAYGMTEASHQMASNPLSGVRKPGSVGMAAGSEVAVLDDGGTVCAAGVVGAVCIRGENVTAGYVGNPAANAEAFRGRWFYTGDLGWMDADGYLYLSGRSKEILNRGGEKISPREIDDVLMEHPAVSQCLTFALPDTRLGEEVGAAVVLQPGAAVEEAELQRWLAPRLSEFKIPRRIFFVEEIPKGATGKPQRIGMAARLGITEDGWRRGVKAGEAGSAETAEKVAQLMAEVLRIGSMEVEADFFDAGGDSILGTQLLARMEREFGCRLTPVDLFRVSTASGLAGLVDGGLRSAGERDVLVRDDDAAPELSYGQVRMWFLDEYEDSGAANLRPAVYELRGAVDAEQLEGAIRRIIERHEPLRTAVVAVDGVPHPMVLGADGFVLETSDWRSAAEEMREGLALEACREEAQRPFQLRREVLLRASLHQLEDERWLLLVVMHHIASDGWSSQVFLAELGALLGGREPAAPAVRYSDFARWQNARLSDGSMQAMADYWRRQLDGISKPLELPTDFARPARQTFHGSIATRRLPQSLACSLRALSRERGATLFMKLLAAFEVQLFRMTGSREFCVGTPVAGRSRVEFEGMIGLFMNTLPLRARLDGDPAFEELLERVKEVCVEAYANQELPFEKMVELLRPERSLSHSPVYQVALQLRNVPKAAVEVPGLSIVERDFDGGTAPLDLNLEVTESGDGLECRLQYNTDLFGRETAERMLRQYEVLLAGIAGSPGSVISRLPLLAEEEVARLRQWGRGPVQEFPDTTVTALVEQQAAARDGEPALLHGDRAMSYGEMNRQANRVSRLLASLGVQAGDVVALCVERSPELFVAMIAALKAGAAYLPLNPADPGARIRALVEDSGARVVVADGGSAERCAGVGAKVVYIEDWPAATASYDDSNPPAAATAKDLVYVLYTSGSTGVPKAVEIEHRNLVNHLFTFHSTRVEPGQTTLQYTAPTFDLSAVEIWGALSAGGRCALYDERKISAAGFGEAVARYNVPFCWMTSSLFHSIVDEAPEVLRPLRRMVIGGEVLSATHVRRAQRVLPETEIVNGYGPTECTILCVDYRVPRPVSEDAASIPIGRPAPNCVAYVVDAELRMVGEGVPGELCIGGACVGRGYRGRPEMTAERFVANPFGDADAPILYRTGDLVKWRSDGLLEFVGRMDHQVKVRGQRVELGEIEAAMRRHPSISRAAVTVSGEVDAGTRLEAFAELQRGAAATDVEIRDFLGGLLPGYMVPSSMTIVERMPTLPSGKLDRKSFVAALGGGRRGDSTRRAPTTDAEKKLATIWADLLGRAPASAEANFFEMGGHSLLALRLSARVEKQFGCALPVRRIFESPTLEGMARALGG